VSVRGHKSNAVPLTQWSGTIVQESVLDYDPAARLHISCTGVVEGVGDVHAFRATIGGSLVRADSIALRVSAPCDYTFSGSWTSRDFSYELSGRGQMSPVEQTKEAGGLTSLAFSPALPAQWESTFGDLEDTTLAGRLKVTDLVT